MSRASGECIAINTDVRVLREGDGWIAVDKPAPLLVHPTNESKERTLWHILNELLVFELNTGGALSLINRLDRETSGITLAAKGSSSARKLGKAMQSRRIVKEYMALVYGHPDWEYRKVDEPIARKGDVEESRVWVRQMVHPGGKDCCTEFFLQERFEYEGRRFSLIKCRPVTGRMHQIRVHLAHIGYSIVGDKIYGPSEECYLRFMETGWTPELEEILWLPRHALHASFLSFPYEDEEIRVESSLPSDWDALFSSGRAGKN